MLVMSQTPLQELQDLKEMLAAELGSDDRQAIRASIDKYRKGENRRKLSLVHVVGVRPSNS